MIENAMLKRAVFVNYKLFTSHSIWNMNSMRINKHDLVPMYRVESRVWRFCRHGHGVEVGSVLAAAVFRG